MRSSRAQHSSHARSYGVSLLAIFICLAIAGAARADAPETQRAAARELGTIGMEAYFDQDFSRAADNLDRAYRLYPTPTLGLWSGRALIQVGQWVRAAERLREVQFASAAIGDNDAQRQAQADAASELAALVPRIPRLIIVVDGASPDEVTLEVDGVPFDRRLIGIAHPSDPGHHRITGTHRDQRVLVELELQANASEVARVELEPEAKIVERSSLPIPAVTPVLAPAQLATPAEPRSNALRVAAIASFSLGGLALATSLVTTLLASSRLDACSERAGEYYCSDRDADAYEAYRTAAAISFYGGAALAGAGLVLWFVQPSADKQKAVSVAAKPLGAQLTVAF